MPTNIPYLSTSKQTCRDDCCADTDARKRSLFHPLIMFLMATYMSSVCSITSTRPYPPVRCQGTSSKNIFKKNFEKNLFGENAATRFHAEHVAQGRMVVETSKPQLFHLVWNYLHQRPDHQCWFRHPCTVFSHFPFHWSRTKPRKGQPAFPTCVASNAVWVTDDVHTLTKWMLVISVGFHRSTTPHRHENNTRHIIVGHATVSRQVNRCAVPLSLG